MSTLAVVEIHDCDGCGAIATVHAHLDAALDKFAAEWFTGLQKDFCPVCRDKLKHQAAILSEESDLNRLVTRRAKHTVETETTIKIGRIG